MNISDRLRRYTDRGFSPDTAVVNVLIEDTLQTLFKRFPDTFIFFGGASLVLFYGSQRHSRDLGLLISAGQAPTAVQLRDAIQGPLDEVAELLGLRELQIEEARGLGTFIKLRVASGQQLLFTIDLTKISAAISSELTEVLLPNDDDDPVPIALPSRNLELLFKAEALLTRRVLKVRDAFDIKLLQDSGAALNENLKVHLSNGPAAERLEPEFIIARIEQITRNRCQPELQPYLPEDLYRKLNQDDFKPLREAVLRLFAEWL